MYIYLWITTHLKLTLQTISGKKFLKDCCCAAEALHTFSQRWASDKFFVSRQRCRENCRERPAQY